MPSTLSHTSSSCGAEKSRHDTQARNEKQSVVRLFVERMQREGRLGEWRTTLAAVQSETGQKYGQAKWEAMRRCGYQNAEVERYLEQQYSAAKPTGVSCSSVGQTEIGFELTNDVDTSTASSLLEAADLDDEAEEYDGRFDHIPMYADPLLELEWALSHELLTEPGQLIMDDKLMCPYHGDAPSFFASMLVQFFVDLNSDRMPARSKKAMQRVLCNYIKEHSQKGID